MIFVTWDIYKHHFYISISESEEFTEKLTDIYLFSFQNKQKIASFLESRQTLNKIEEAQAECTYLTPFSKSYNNLLSTLAKEAAKKLAEKVKKMAEEEVISHALQINHNFV